VLQRAMRDGNAPTMARWLAEGSHRFVEWETDLSSQTGASQAGILIGSNEDIPAFRWVEKESAKLVACSGPADCAEIERRHASDNDLLVYGVLTDMMKGRPAIYATFSSYDEVAHHSGLERADTLEALRKLDQQFSRIERARTYAARPYEIVALSDHGQTQGATFKQRNGYGLDDLVERSLSGGSVMGIAGGDEQSATVGNATAEATGQRQKHA